MPYLCGVPYFISEFAITFAINLFQISKKEQLYKPPFSSLHCYVQSVHFICFLFLVCMDVYIHCSLYSAMSEYSL